VCRKQGRSDLAREAALEAHQSVLFQNALSASYANGVFMPGVSDETWMRLAGTSWMGLSLLFQLVITLPAWGALGLLLWVKRVPGDAKRARAVFLVALVAQLPAFIIAAAGIYVAVMSGAGQFLGNAPAGNSGEQLMALLRWLVALSPLLFSALLCGAITWWRQRQARREINNSGAWAAVRPSVRRSITLLLWLMTLLSVPAVFFASSVGVSAPELTLENFWLDPANFVFGTLLSPWFPTYMLLVCVAWWVASGVWLQATPALPLAGEGLRWYHRALGASLLLVSVFYLVVLLYSTQVRREANAGFYALLRQGEVATLLKAASGTQSAPDVP
jgi:hypothetical protein